MSVNRYYITKVAFRRISIPVLSKRSSNVDETTKDVFSAKCFKKVTSLSLIPPSLMILIDVDDTAAFIVCCRQELFVFDLLPQFKKNSLIFNIKKLIILRYCVSCYVTIYSLQIHLEVKISCLFI